MWSLVLTFAKTFCTNLKFCTRFGKSLPYARRCIARLEIKKYFPWRMRMDVWFHFWYSHLSMYFNFFFHSVDRMFFVFKILFFSFENETFCKIWTFESAEMQLFITLFMNKTRWYQGEIRVRRCRGSGEDEVREKDRLQTCGRATIAWVYSFLTFLIVLGAVFKELENGGKTMGKGLVTIEKLNHNLICNWMSQKAEEIWGEINVIFSQKLKCVRRIF